MKQYLNLLSKIMNEGIRKDDRTGTGTLSLFGEQIRFNLQEGFPLLTTKKVYMRGITHELLWFLKGDTNIKYLVDRNVKIWNEWPYEGYKKSDEYQGESLDEFVEKIKEDQNFADKWGDLGPVYGKQWIRWTGKNGEEINQMYLNFYDVKKLSFNQISDTYADIGKKLGGDLKIKLANEKISVEIAKSPFGKNDTWAMNKILSVVFAKIASLNLGYARAVVSEPKDQNVVIDVYLKREDK